MNERQLREARHVGGQLLKNGVALPLQFSESVFAGSLGGVMDLKNKAPALAGDRPSSSQIAVRCVPNPSRSREDVLARDAWFEIGQTNPSASRSDIDRSMELSEAELVALACGASGPLRVRRLIADWPGMLRAMSGLGSVQATTSNDHAFLEACGRFEFVETLGSLGRAVGGIDLRFSLGRWRFGFFVQETVGQEITSSVRIFDLYGNPMHQITAVGEDQALALESMLKDYISDERLPVLDLDPPPSRVQFADEHIDVAVLREAWLRTRDELDLALVLAAFRITKPQALRLAGDELAFQVPAETFEKVIALCAEFELPFRVMVGNPGTSQTHVGAMSRPIRVGSWIVSNGRGFSLRVRDGGVESAWIVRTPHNGNALTSLELFSGNGEQIVKLCSAPGDDARIAWAVLVSTFAEGADGPD